MPLGIVLVGLLLIVTAVKGTEHELATQLESDMVGTGGNAGFLEWFASITALGFIGYIPGFNQPSRYLIALIFAVMVLKSDTGVFDKLSGAIDEATKAGPAPSIPLPSASDPGSASGTGSGSQKTSSSGGGILGGILDVAKVALPFAGPVGMAASVAITAGQQFAGGKAG